MQPSNVHRLFAAPTTYGPEQLKTLVTAFEGAWQSVAGNFGDTSNESARTTLASIILAMPCDEISDAERIKNLAIQAMAARYRDIAKRSAHLRR